MVHKHEEEANPNNSQAINLTSLEEKEGEAVQWFLF